MAEMTMDTHRERAGGSAHETLTTIDADSLAASETGSLFFIGTATVLLELGPFTVLTDPNFLHQGESVGIGYGLVNRVRYVARGESVPLPPPTRKPAT